ncbi:unnamed protein product, partial [Symbiodinium necroappetens]
MDTLPWLDLSQESHHKFRYLAFSIFGVWVAAIGRWEEGCQLGAENDLVPGILGVWLFQNQLFRCCGSSEEEQGQQELENGPVQTGTTCLIPFVLLAAVNAFFDFLMVLVAYPECFESVMAAKGTLCAESFFTFGAGVFQACSAILAFQIWWSMPQSSGYSLVLQARRMKAPSLSFGGLVHLMGGRMEGTGRRFGFLTITYVFAQLGDTAVSMVQEKVTCRTAAFEFLQVAKRSGSRWLSPQTWPAPADDLLEKCEVEGVEHKVQLQDDSIWKEVLGHKAYQQYASSASHKASKTTTAETVETTAAAVATTSSVPSSHSSSSSSSHSSSSSASSSSSSSARTTTAMAQTQAPRPGLIISTNPQEETQRAPVSNATDADRISKMDDVAKEFMNEASKLDPDSAEHHSLKRVAHFLSGMATAKKRITSTTPSPKLPQLAGNVSQMPLHSELAPLESLNDGNKCASDEEEMMGTCYKKCVDLTGGYFPIRTSPFSCCEAEPCGFQNTRVHLSFCSGFDVAGDQEGKGCPNFEGACLTDEELFDGLCYKKCSLFPSGYTYNHRVAPNMCCSTHGLKCLLPKYFKFSTDFAVGGGRNDGNAQTPSFAHAPMKELTEVEARTRTQKSQQRWLDVGWSSCADQWESSRCTADSLLLPPLLRQCAKMSDVLRRWNVSHEEPMEGVLSERLSEITQASAPRAGMIPLNISSSFNPLVSSIWLAASRESLESRDSGPAVPTALLASKQAAMTEPSSKVAKGEEAVLEIAEMLFLRVSENTQLASLLDQQHSDQALEEFANLIEKLSDLDSAPIAISPSLLSQQAVDSVCEILLRSLQENSDVPDPLATSLAKLTQSARSEPRLSRLASDIKNAQAAQRTALDAAAGGEDGEADDLNGDFNIMSFEELDMPEHEAKQVQEVWSRFNSFYDSSEAAGEAMFDAILDASPTLGTLFKMPRAVASMRLQEGINQIINSLRNPKQTKQLVDVLGFKHLNLEVTGSRVRIIRDALVELVASEVIASHSRQALGSFIKVLNYIGGALLYIRATYAQRLQTLSTSWAEANRDRDKVKKASGEKKPQDTAQLMKQKMDEHVPEEVVYIGEERMAERRRRQEQHVPKTFYDMFCFNAAVMDLLQDWMFEILDAFDDIVCNAANVYRLQEECDVLVLKISKLDTEINLDDFKAVMLASLRSLLPKDWTSAHEEVWCWLWESVQSLLNEELGKPAARARILSRYMSSLDDQARQEIGEEVYRNFFTIVPAGQDYMKQSRTRLHFIADSVMRLSGLFAETQRNFDFHGLVLGFRAHDEPPLCVVFGEGSGWEEAAGLKLFNLDRKVDTQITLQWLFEDMNCDAIRTVKLSGEELYQEPYRMVDELSALGLRHVGYAVPTEFFGPFVNAFIEVVKDRVDDPPIIESFSWSLGLMARMLVRTIKEGSTIVMKAINQNSKELMGSALICAPRGERFNWVLTVAATRRGDG